MIRASLAAWLRHVILVLEAIVTRLEPTREQRSRAPQSAGGDGSGKQRQFIRRLEHIHMGGIFRACGDAGKRLIRCRDLGHLVLHQGGGSGASLRRDFLARQHAGNFLGACEGVKWLSTTDHTGVAGGLGDAHVMKSFGCNLR